MQRIPASFLPSITLDAASGVPMHRQLSEWFRRAIVDGRLRPGQRVPSSRSLASELKISRIPVLSAYEQLYAEARWRGVKGRSRMTKSQLERAVG